MGYGSPKAPPAGPLVVVYWQGQRRQPDLNVRRDCNFDPERKGYVLRIKRPDKLNISGIEMLSMQGEDAQLPESVVREVLFVLSRGHARHGLRRGHAPVIRLQESPDLVETKDEQEARVKAKKVRKAVTAATSNCLRMGPTVKQARRRVAGLKAVEHLLDEDEKILLRCLKAQLIATLGAIELSRNLRQRGE